MFNAVFTLINPACITYDSFHAKVYAWAFEVMAESTRDIPEHVRKNRRAISLLTMHVIMYH